MSAVNKKSNGKSANKEVTRAGTVVETRGAGRSKRKTASTKKEPMRAGTVVETRASTSGRSGNPPAREQMRDGK